MEEIVPGIHHWTAMHPDIHMRVSSHYVEPAGIVIDPLEPEDGFGFFDALDVAPQQVVLTNGLHWRHSDRFAERYGATVRVVSAGLPRFEGTDRQAEPFEYGDEVAPGVTAVEIDGICPDDSALHIEHGDGAVAFADGLIRMGGVLGFVPDGLWGDDPRREQEAVRDSLRGLLTREFDALLFAHGDPLPKGGRSALRDFLKKPVGQPDFGHTA
jgi:hypothetical protein